MKSNTEIIIIKNNTFISISIFFKVFKNLCLNYFFKKMHYTKRINYSGKLNLEKKK